MSVCNSHQGQLSLLPSMGRYYYYYYYSLYIRYAHSTAYWFMPPWRNKHIWIATTSPRWSATVICTSVSVNIGYTELCHRQGQATTAHMAMAAYSLSKSHLILELDISVAFWAAHVVCYEADIFYFTSLQINNYHKFLFFLISPLCCTHNKNLSWCYDCTIQLQTKAAFSAPNRSTRLCPYFLI